MKKEIFPVLVLSLAAFCSLILNAENPDRLYANCVITVFKLDNLEGDVVSKLKMPIPEVYTKSWLHTSLSLDITAEKPQIEMLEKEDLSFILSAESPGKLSIKVMDKNQARFSFEHCNPSSAHYIFFGPNSRAYLMKVVFTVADHRMGPMGPGIKR